MHSAQTRALLAILTMVEAGLREIRAVLTDASPQDATGGPVAAPFKAHIPDGVLSDEEELTLERMMDKHRLDLLAAAENMTEKYYGDGPYQDPFSEEDRP